MRSFAGLLLLSAAAPILAQSATPTPSAAVEEAKSPFDKAKAATVVAELATQLEDNFVFPDKAKAYAAMLRANLQTGRYAAFPDAQAFADAVTADLQAVHKDGHLRLHVVPKEARSGPASERRGPPHDINGVTKSGWLADGVAYISFGMFPGNEVTLGALKTFLDTHATAKTLIIDARAHRGGALAEMNMLFPQIFAEPAVLVEMDTRLAVEQREGNPMADEAFVRKVAGPETVVRSQHFVEPAARQTALRDAKVYLLTSGRTASAGEHLALSLKRTKRATLIGETTRGAGHYGGMVPLDKEFTYAAFIPVGRTFDPDTGEGWEGKGIAPDIAVPADKALDEALRLAGVSVSGEVALASIK
jgi:hypothetical protein